MKRNIKTHPINNSGYTLIEMAIALMVIGLLLGSAIALYAQYIKQSRVDTTLANIDTAAVKLNTFQHNQGRLPCPAPLNVPRTDSKYGAEDTAACTAAIAAGAGTCTNGICVERTVRTDLVGTDNFVLVGALPFRTLQIPEDNTFDGYKSRLVYAVTYSATSDVTYNTNKGAISVIGDNGASLTTLAGSVLYLTLSPGEDRIGAYSNLGTLVFPCAADTNESENCNVGFETGTALSTASVYRSMLHSTGANNNYFDDYISYYAKSSDPTWRRTTANFNDIQDLSPRFIGVGANGTDVQALQIISSGTTDSLRVYGSDGQNGTITTARVCDENGNNCFSPTAIAGKNADGEGMRCATAGQYMYKIANGQSVCAPVAIACPSATPVLKGFNASGAPICSTTPVVNCPEKSFVICPSTSNPKTIIVPAGSTNQTWAPSPTVTAGDCRVAKFKCTSSSWAESGSTGNCAPPTPVNTNVACGTVLNPSYPWSWSGTAIKTVTTSACGTATTTYNISNCKCNKSSVSGALACPSPYNTATTYTGTIKSECYGIPDGSDGTAPEPSSTPKSYTGPTYVPAVSLHAPLIIPVTDNSSSCKCATSDGIEFRACSAAGNTRKTVPSPLTFALTPFAWPSASPTFGEYRTRTVDGTTCVASYTPWDSNNCTCDTTPTYTKVQKTCTATCESPSMDTLTIPGVSISMTKGDIVYKTERDATTCALKPPEEIYAGECKPQSYSWTSLGVKGTYTAGNRPSNVVGGGCSCAEHTSGVSANCRGAGDASNAIYECKCQ